MTPAETTARALLDALNDRAFDRIHDLVTPDFVDDGAPPGTVPPGPDGYVAVLRFLADVLQLRYEVHDVVADGDTVAIRATAHGVHATDHLGVPATGRPYAMQTAHFYRAEGDRMAEHWGIRDELGVLVQVGAIAPPALPPLAGVAGAPSAPPR